MNPFASPNSDEPPTPPPRGNGAMIAVAVVIAIIGGFFVAGFAFGFAWAFAESRVRNSQLSVQGWIFSGIILTATAIGGYITGRPLGQRWWITSSLIVAPMFLVLGGPLLRNLQMGHTPWALLYPFPFVAIAAFAGGYVGGRR